MRLMAFVTLLLVAIVAIGNWQLFARMARVEAILELRAMPQLQQKSSSQQ